jgi:hypothetical protein
VQPQNLQDDVLAHGVGQIWVDETNDRDAVRQIGVAQDVVDPGAEGKDQLQLRQ